MGAPLAPTLQGKWLGNLDWGMKMTVHLREHGYPGDGLGEAIKELGPVFNMRVLWKDSIMTADMGCRFQQLREGFQFSMNSVLGSGVFNSDGEMWKFHRAMTWPFFSREKIRHFDIFDSHTE
ncbi:hypothetical protein C8R45DRAFT_1095288 [Mycena sanguinolenta]|nr:hypothetical protein C8R45DRAFT_1095288 [Mycena sanguinolenta]